MLPGKRRRDSSRHGSGRLDLSWRRSHGFATFNAMFSLGAMCGCDTSHMDLWRKAKDRMFLPVLRQRMELAALGVWLACLPPILSLVRTLLSCPTLAADCFTLGVLSFESISKSFLVNSHYSETSMQNMSPGSSRVRAVTLDNLRCSRSQGEEKSFSWRGRNPYWLQCLDYLTTSASPQNSTVTHFDYTGSSLASTLVPPEQCRDCFQLLFRYDHSPPRLQPPFTIEANRAIPPVPASHVASWRSR